MYAVLKVYEGDWSNGMTEVSKTFSGSSILSSPVIKALRCLKLRRSALFVGEKAKVFPVGKIYI